MNIIELKNEINEKKFKLEKYVKKFDKFFKDKVLRIGIVGGSPSYENFIKKISDNVIIYNPNKEGIMSDSDFILFTGGEDVCPDYYNDIVHRTTSYNRNRDALEKQTFDYSQRYGIPTVGICRGSQFLCVMHGGSLIQHMSHNSSHSVNLIYDDKTKITVTSTHHQMQNPSQLNDSEYIILADSVEKSPFLFKGDNTNLRESLDKDCEIVLYKGCYNHSPSLAIQGHPEMVFATSEFEKLSLDLIKMMIIKNKNKKAEKQLDSMSKWKYEMNPFEVRKGQPVKVQQLDVNLVEDQLMDEELVEDRPGVNHQEFVIDPNAMDIQAILNDLNRVRNPFGNAYIIDRMDQVAPEHHNREVDNVDPIDIPVNNDIRAVGGRAKRGAGLQVRNNNNNNNNNNQ
jgi:gamma-glutamyl-gamma-aminobutyrate hydrolase PuuD